MEQNNLITIASISERKERIIDINDKLEPQSECCIYRVPRDLRKINRQAYSPTLISIGPLHYGKKEFVDMEKQKIRYKREFSKRITEEKWQELISFLDESEQSIRNCYEEACKLQKFEYISMILYDAVFIIELFLRDHKYRQSDFLLHNPKLRSLISLDLQLLENQLPYFVLNQIYLQAFPDPIANARDYPSFFTLSCQFFDCMELTEIHVEEKVHHFTDLRRYYMIGIYQEPKSKEFIIDLPCAVKLRDSGVNFKCHEDRCLLDVKLGKEKGMIPCLGAPELQIGRIEIFDETEVLFRNVMALEQCHYPSESQVCNFIDLIDHLIDTKEDVDLLAEAGIISNNLGDSAKVCRMVNKLCLQINVSDSGYHHVVDKLKAHQNNPWNHNRATLRSVYFRNLWRGTGTCAATLLLLLTIVQTVFSVLQVV